jgi:xanthine dehydrogenase accessory factor
MAFTDAIFDGRAVLEGVVALRVDDLQALPALLAARTRLPVVATDDVSSLLRVVSPEVLIDARLRKRLHPEVQRGLAPLTMGLGPNFTAGVTTDLIVDRSPVCFARRCRLGPLCAPGPPWRTWAPRC